MIVFKRVTQQTDESQGLQAVALMQQGKCVDLNPELAIYAGKLSIQHKLPMADSIILATTYTFQATLKGIAIFAKACFGHPGPSKRQKLNATSQSLRRPSRPATLVLYPTRGIKLVAQRLDAIS